MAADIVKRLSKLRIGVLFRESRNQPANAYDEDWLRQLYGVTTVRIRPKEFEKAMDSVSAERLARIDEELRPNLHPYASKTLERAARVYAAIEQFVEREHLDIFVGDCVKMGSAFGANCCLALWKLYPRGIVVGCEGDMAGAIAFWIMRQLSTEVAMFDVTSVVRTRLSMSHCSIPFVSGRVRHGCFGTQVVQHSQLKPGPATLLQVSGVHADTWHITRVQVTESSTSEGLNVEASVQTPERFIENVRGNHFVLAYGAHTEALVRVAEQLGLRTLVD